MRLSNFLVTFSACALFAACANDEMPGGNNLPQGNGEQAFIAVRLAAPNAMTRAFQDGKNEENAVTTARFYFFNNEGTAVTVDNSVNYKDVSEAIAWTESINHNLATFIKQSGPQIVSILKLMKKNGEVTTKK